MGEVKVQLPSNSGRWCGHYGSVHGDIAAETEYSGKIGQDAGSRLSVYNSEAAGGDLHRDGEAQA